MKALLLSAVLAQWMGTGDNYGIIEVCGPGGCTMVGTLNFNDDVKACWGTSSDSCMEYDTAQTADGLVIGLGTDSETLHLTQTADMSVDWGHPDQNTPTLVIHNSDQTNTDYYIELQHDGTNAVIDSGSGAVNIQDEIEVDNYVRSTTTTGGSFYMQDSTAPGVNSQENGEIIFQGYDNAGTPNLRTYGEISGTVLDVTTTAEDGAMHFYIMDNGTAATEALRLSGDDTYPEVAVYKNLTIGTGGQWTAGIDDDQICLQERDTAADNICLMTSNDSLLVYQGDGATAGNISVRDMYASGPNGVWSTNSAGGSMRIRDSTSPGVNDATIGTLAYQAYNAAGTPSLETYVQLEGFVEEVTDADEDGRLIVSVMNNGALATVLTLDADDTKETITAAWPINIGAGGQWKAGIADDQICLQERDTAADNLCFKTDSDGLIVYQGDGATRAFITGAAITANGALTSQSSAPNGGSVHIWNTITTGANDRLAGDIQFYSDDSVGATTEYASILTYSEEVTNGDEDGSVYVKVMSNGALIDALVIDTTDGVDLATFALDIKAPDYTLTTATDVCYDLLGQGSSLGPTAPSFAKNETAGGYGFDAVGETIYIKWEIPNCYDGTTDPSLKFYWTPKEADVPQQNEEVDWEMAYRVVDWSIDADDADSRAAVTVNAEYTEADNPGDDKDLHITATTLDQNDANQPITAGLVLIGAVNRDVTNEGTSYSGEAILNRIVICIKETALTCDNH